MTPGLPSDAVPMPPSGGGGNACPRCGLALQPLAPPELCPRCLLGAGLTGGAGMSDEPAVDGNRRFGPYQLGSLLGKGGMGEVYEAVDLESGRRLALKILSQRLDSPNARKRFLNEGVLAAAINHPNSVYVFGTEEVAGVPVIAMELMSGGNLEDRIQAQGPMTIQEAADVALQIIDGLTAAHAAGVLHRDIKPSNCFLDADGTVKLGDYGLSVSPKGHERAAAASESFMGTPAFASPEQLRGDDLTARSDIYSLGITLFVMLTGKVPFEAKDSIRLIARVLEGPAPDPRGLRPEIPIGLAEVLLRCLAKRPDSRYSDCEALRTAIFPYSSRGKTAAQLWQRLVAGTVDIAIMGVPYAIVASIITRNVESFAGVVLHLAWLFCMILAAITCFAWLEWKYGKTPGKSLLGMEVRAEKVDSSPWIAGGRFLLRSTLFILLPILAVLYMAPPLRTVQDGSEPLTIVILGVGLNAIKISSHLEWDPGLTTAALWLAAMMLPFIGSNRKSGWVSLHDRLSKTRVVSRAEWECPRLAVDHVNALPVDDVRWLGPFQVLEYMPDADDWLIGYDPKLLRKVWLHQLQPGAAPVSANIRNLKRPGRLRWLAGQRTTDQNWDAYEFPGGRALCGWQAPTVMGEAAKALTSSRVSWQQLRTWLTDLTTELCAASVDGSLPADVCIERIWITGDGRAKFLDFSAPGVRTCPAYGGSSVWLELVERCLDRRGLPLPVVVLLSKLPVIHNPAELLRELQYLDSVPHELSIARRLGVIAASIMGPLLLGLGTAFMKGLSFPTALFWGYVVLIAGVALPAIAAAGLFGGGIVFRSFGICVVDLHGKPVVGYRAAWRSFLAWLPTLVSPLVVAVLMIWLNPATAALSTLSLLALLAVISVMLPDHASLNRLAGTQLVPR